MSNLTEGDPQGPAAQRRTLDGTAAERVRQKDRSPVRADPDQQLIAVHEIDEVTYLRLSQPQAEEEE